MAVRPIILWPEPWLNQQSVPLLPEEFGSEQLKELAVDLVDTMSAARGVGLAAPQLGVHKRVVVVPNPERLNEGGVLVLCNPVLSEMSPERKVNVEGCLSLPGATLPVERAVSVKVTAKFIDGVDLEAVWSGFAAVAVQHECDHLDGKVIADNISPLRKQLLRKKLKKVMREMQRAQEAEEAKRLLLQKVKGPPPNPSEYTLPPAVAPKSGP